MKAGRRREYKGEGGRRLLWGERTGRRSWP